MAKRAIAGAWIAAVALVVPLAMAAFQNDLHLASWMPRTAKHRIVIWGHTSQLIAKAPILGAGIHTARALHDPNDYDAPRAPGSEFQLTTGLHSHNGYLQTWYEAGAVGAASCSPSAFWCSGRWQPRRPGRSPISMPPSSPVP